MIELTCEYCGKKFQVRNYRAETAKYCSAQCFSSGKSQYANHVKHQLTEVEKAYIAGFFDGEGTITLRKARRKTDPSRYSISPFLIVGNTHEGVINWLRETTGIGIVYGGTKPFKDYWARTWRWQVISNQARVLLVDLLPYLIIKKEEAEIVINFPKMEKRRFDEAIYQKQVECLQTIREINRRVKVKH